MRKDLRILCLMVVSTLSLAVSATEVGITVMVYDKRNREPMIGAEVSLIEIKSQDITKRITNDSGFVRLSVLSSERYRLDVSKNALGSSVVFLTYSYILDGKDARHGQIFEVELEKVQRDNSGLIPSTFFDYNSTYLNADNVAVLENAVKLLNDFKTLRIQILVNSDCREKVDVSKQRVSVIEKFFNENGELLQRVEVKDYGSTKPLNQCNCSLKIECEEAKFFENRRAEFKILSF